MASYRIGPSDLFTPSDLQADADTLQGQVTLLDAAFQASGGVTPGDDLVNAWVLFQGDWAAFYADHFATFIDRQLTAFNDSNRDQLIQFEQRFASLRDRFTAIGVQTNSEIVAPKTDTGPFGLGGILTPVIVVLVLVIVGLVVLSKVTK